MIPLFKSTYSIGKSILTLEEPSKVKDGEADSILKIAEEESLEQIFLLEDPMIGFLDAHTKCQASDIQLIFGLRMNCCNDVSQEQKGDSHKIAIFAKNDQGVKALTKIYSLAHKLHQGFVDSELLKNNWSDDLKLCIPFYDSFIYVNNFLGKMCLPNFKFTQPTFFVESNGLPFDQFVQAKVEKYAAEMNAPIQKAKSIYYKNKEDFDAWQTYKCLCNRSFGKERSLSNPNLEHCGSNTFCWEAFKNER